MKRADWPYAAMTVLVGLVSIPGCGPGGIHALGKELDEMAMERALERARGGRPSQPESMPAYPPPKVRPQPSVSEPAPKVEAKKKAIAAPGPRLPPLVDSVPERLGTPAQSEAMRPAFSYYASRYAPPYAYGSRVYGLAQDVGDSDSVVGLICEITSGDQRDEPGGGVPDLSVSVTLTQGKQKPIRFYEKDGEDEDTMYFSIPLVRLAKGDRLSVSLIDRDVIFDEGIETLDATFQGQYPWIVKGKIASMECRPVSRDLSERLVNNYREQVDAALTEMDGMRPDLVQDDFGLGGSYDIGLGRTQRALDDLAGYTGWDDPRVQRRIERMKALADMIEKDLGKRVEEMRSTLPPPSAGLVSTADSALWMHPQLDCGPEVAKRYKSVISSKPDRVFSNQPCVIELLAENRSGVLFGVDEFFGHLGPVSDMRVVTIGGKVSRVQMVAIQKDGKAKVLDHQRPALIEGNKSATIILVLDRDLGLLEQRQPMLLRVSHTSRFTNKPRAWTRMAGGTLEMRADKLLCGAEAAAHYNAQIPVFSRPSWERPPMCVVLVDIKRTGETPVKINGFFHRLDPVRAFSLVNPAEFPADVFKIGAQGSPFGPKMEGPTFSKVYATIRPSGTFAVKDDIELRPGEQISVAIASEGNGSWPSAPDLNTLVLRAWFDKAYSFVRIE